MIKGFIDCERVTHQNDYSMSKLHSHPYFELYFLEDGTRQIIFPDRLFEIRKNQLAVIPPSVMHKTEGGPYTRSVITIPPKCLSAMEQDVLMKCAEKGVLTFPQKELINVKKTLDYLFDYFAMDLKQQDAAFIQQSLIDYFIFLLYRNISNDSVSAPEIKHTAPPLVLRILAHLEKNYMKNIPLKQLAQTFYMSTVTLHRQFKQYTNLSIKEYLIQLRLNKAKELLRLDKAHRLSMNDVAISCGFSSANYFSLMFKKNVGIAPTSYRKHETEK